MRRLLLPGAVLAVATSLLVWFGDALGLNLAPVALLGAALGGVIGLVPDRPPLERVGGFAVGAVAAWVGYGLRAALLPDAASGRAVAAMVVIGLCLLAAGGTRGRLPLWSALLGVAAVVGAYESIYTNAPSQFLAESPTAGTTVLLAAALGFLATVLLGEQVEAERLEANDEIGVR